MCVKTRQRVKPTSNKSCFLRLHVYVRWAGFNPWSLPQLSDPPVFRLQMNPLTSSFAVLQTPGHRMSTRNSYIKLICSGADLLPSGSSSQTTEQIFRLSLAALSAAYLSSGWRSWILFIEGSLGQGGSMLFGVFSISLMFLQTFFSQKWLLPIILVCCDHTLTHPVVMIQISHKKQLLQQEAEQELITPVATSTNKA